MIRRALTSPLWLKPVKRHVCTPTMMVRPPACSECGKTAEVNHADA
jgi:hypothetical protein